MKQFLIAADQLANTIAGGYADETLSSRCWRGGRRRAVAVIDALFFWQRDHCKSSYEAERMRLQLPRSCERSGKSTPVARGLKSGYHWLPARACWRSITSSTDNCFRS